MPFAMLLRVVSIIYCLRDIRLGLQMVHYKLWVEALIIWFCGLRRPSHFPIDFGNWPAQGAVGRIVAG